MKPMIKFLIGTFAIFLIIINVIHFSDYFQGRGTNQWIQTPCKILTSQVGTKDFGKSGSKPVLEVEYSYIVEGVEYISNRIAFGFDNYGFSYDELLDQKKSFWANSIRDVYYDPDNRKESTLVKGVEYCKNPFLDFILKGLLYFVIIIIYKKCTKTLSNS